MTLPYTLEGTGRPLVLVHGFPLDRRMWEGQSPLARDCALIRFDLPGFGVSPAPPGPATMGSYAAHAIQILDECGIDRATFCGLSMGGYILFEIWRRNPERVAALILSDTRAEPDSPEGRASREAAMAQVRAGGSLEFVRAMLPKLLAPASSGRPEIEGLMREMMENASPEGIVSALGALRDRPDSRPSLAGITVPTLIVVGQEDLLTPPKASQEMHRSIPGSTLVEIPAAGHMAPLESPGAFNAAVRDFLRSTGL